MESVVRCAAFVRYSEFGGCTLFGSRKCTASTGTAVGTSTVVRYSEEVRYWEGPLSEVPLYTGNIRASVDALCRDGADKISRDPRRKRLKPRRESLAKPSKLPSNCCLAHL